VPLLASPAVQTAQTRRLFEPRAITNPQRQQGLFVFDVIRGERRSLAGASG
jgi:hypothetical protein